MPVAEVYTDPIQAAVYDSYNPSGPEDLFLRALAGSKPIRVLDLGCGTGRLAVAFTADGHQVVGADPAAAMLDVARHQPGAEAVTWVAGDADSIHLCWQADLIVMAGHVFQVFLDDAAGTAALVGAARHLAPGGRLVFTTRNPARREWETWESAASPEVLDVAGLGRVRVWDVVTAVRGDLVTFATRIALPDGRVRSAANTVRFPSRAQVSAQVAAAGMRADTCLGDWDGRPFAEDSPEIILVAVAMPQPVA